MARILLADDERDLVWALQNSLAHEGYEVLTAYDGVQAMTLARRHRPDIVILDIAMPGLDGLEVCRSMREDPTLAAVPILFLTVRGGVENRVAGLDEGGDDYLVKPFNTRELKARIRALLRRSRSIIGETPARQVKEHILAVGLLRLDLHTHQAHIGEKAISLTPIEFDLLCYLMNHPGQVLSSEKLLQAVWGYTESKTASGLVRWHIKNLRLKIEPDPAHPSILCTVPRHGYILRRDA